MNYAAVLGIYFLIKFFISVFAGQDTLLLSVSMVMTLIVPYIVYLIQKNYRDVKLDGTISYSSALLFGIYLFFYSSLILGLGQYIYYQTLFGFLVALITSAFVKKTDIFKSNND